MTVEDLIGLLREMPPTSMVEIDLGDDYYNADRVTYERGFTVIVCARVPEEQ